MDSTPPIPEAPKMCIVSPEETEGPFYETGQMMRKSIAEDKKGVLVSKKL